MRDERLARALSGFDAASFVKRHRGYKESRSPLSHEYLLTCPTCSSDRLRWRHDPKGRQTWICWGCRRSGDSLGLIQLMESCDLAAAIAHVLDGYIGGDAPQQLHGVVTKQQTTVTKLMPWPAGVELLTPMHAQAWAYVANRGITPEQVREYRIGVGRTGKLSGYIVFPVFMDGGLVYWQGRASWDPPANLDSTARKVWIHETHYRKTLNPTAEANFATAADVLFNWDRARTSTHVVICEGPIDAIKVGLYAVALFGKAWSPAKLQRLLRMPAKRYTVYLDRGKEERESALALAGALASYAPTFLATPPDGYDAGSLTCEQNAQIIQMAEPFQGRQLIGGLKA